MGVDQFIRAQMEKTRFDIWLNQVQIPIKKINHSPRYRRRLFVQLFNKKCYLKLRFFDPYGGS